MAAAFAAKTEYQQEGFMTSLSRSLFGVALVAAFSVTLSAQQAPSGYHTVACVKVKPEKATEFRKWAAEDARKVQQSFADSGRISAWLLLRAVMPQGKSAACDYLSISIYPGAPPAPVELSDLGAALKKAGLTMTAQDFVDRRAALTELVSNNMFQNQLSVGTEKKGDYLVVNYMKVPNIADWLAYEKKVWQPMAEVLVKDGVTRGWSVNVQVLPGGSALKFEAVTVDIYPSWDAVFKDFGFAEHFKKAHPDMEVGTTMQAFEKLRTILSSELFTVEDMVTPAK
jgi:hypothetical protein